MFVALLPVSRLFVLLISCELLMKKKEYLISTPSVLLKLLVCFFMGPGEELKSLSNGDGGNQITNTATHALFSSSQRGQLQLLINM